MKRYFYELGGAMLAYGIVLVGSIRLLQSNTFSPAISTAIALSPMIPIAGACWAIIRRLRRMDEMQLRVNLEGFGFAFAATAMVTFSYGFLEGIGYPRLSMFLVWPLMAALWIVGNVIASRRYASA